MNTNDATSLAKPNGRKLAPRMCGASCGWRDESLGFRLFPIAQRQELIEACAVRSLAYGHHLPELGSALAEPDEIDLHPATTVFLCRDKASGEAIGTMRIQTSAHGPLVLERSVALPARLQRSCRAEVTRLAVRVGADPLVKLCLMKASYLFCVAHRVRAMIIGARKESLIRNYRRLGFVDVFADDALRPLAHTGGLLHRILRFDVSGAERCWAQQNHPLYEFMVRTRHQDLQVDRHEGAPDDCADGVSACADPRAAAHGAWEEPRLAGPRLGLGLGLGLAGSV